MTSFVTRDQQSIWHPYTQMKTASDPIAIVRGEGAYLYDDQGKRYLDAIASWWVNIHGHANPHIAQKIYEQAQKLEHVIFAGFTHAPAIEVAERVLKYLPDYHRVFFSDNGSTSVEVALKQALQFFSNQGQSKTKLIAFEDAYHGDTLGAMSVSSRGAFTKAFEPWMFETLYIPAPTPGNEQKSLDALKQHLAQHTDVAAFIFEPLVQGVAGMVMHEASALDALIQECRKHQVLTIADEVFTGFYRTGTRFAVDQLQAKPDFVCLSKGLTGGTLPMSLTLCTQEIYEGFYSDNPEHTFFHGHSYTANPLACAAALATLDLLEEEECQMRIKDIMRHHEESVDYFKGHEALRSVKAKGVILVLEVESGDQTSYFSQIRDQLYEYFISQGFLLRPLGNLIYVLPPYCVTTSELDQIREVIEDGLDSFVFGSPRAASEAVL